MINDAVGDFDVKNSNEHIPTSSNTSLASKALLNRTINKRIVTESESSKLYGFMVVSIRSASFAVRVVIFPSYLIEWL